MKLVLVFICLLIIPTEWLTDFETAKTTASTENKYILLNFSGSDWCGPCVKMKQEVFGSEAFQTLADEKLILLRADFPRAKKNLLSKEQTKHNEALAEKYNPSGKFPYTLLLTAEGKILHEWDGYAFATQDKFIEELNTAIGSK